MIELITREIILRFRWIFKIYFLLDSSIHIRIFKQNEKGGAWHQLQFLLFNYLAVETLGDLQSTSNLNNNFFNHTIDHDSTDSHVCDAFKLALAFTCQTGRRLHLWKVSLVKTFPFNTPNTTPIHTFARIVGKYYHRCLIWLTTSDRTVGSNSKVRRE